MEELLDNPMLLAVGGLLLAVLAGLGVRAARKRRALKKQFSDSAILSETELKTNSMFGATGGQIVDTNNSVFNSNFSPSASQLDTNEVDPVAEADVYIAYGRDTQAEEILKEALRTQPERHAVRVKLLEIYASRKDMRAFDAVATELYSMTKGEGLEWEQAALLGSTIDPKNPLYANSGAMGAKGMLTSVAALAAIGAAGTPPAEARSTSAAALTGGEDLDLDALLNATSGSYAEGESLHGKQEPTLDDALAPAAQALSVPIEAAAAPAAAVDDGNLLEFSAPPVMTPAAAPVEAESDGNTLDFEFDLGALDAPAPLNAPLAQAEPDAVPAQVPTLNEAAPQSLDMVSAQTSALDFNFDLLKPVDSLPADATMGGDAPADGLGDALQLPATAGEPPADELPALSPTPLAFDLSSISLDLGTPDNAASSIAAVADPGTGLGNAEMATKLDLALAYQEIGDIEGARELLDEVARGGSPAQVEKAQSLIRNMA